MTDPVAAFDPIAPFTLALAEADHWGRAAKACQEALAGVAANVGFLYVSEVFNQNLSSILTFLRETTRIPHWVGAVVPGLIAGMDEVPEGGVIAVLAGTLPEGSFMPFRCLAAAELDEQLGPWLAVRRPCLGIAHGDPRSPGMAALVAALAQRAGFVVGGLISSSGPPAQLADSVVSGGLAGLLLGPEVPVVTGLTQGCSPIGPAHVVTEAANGVVMRLDGRPALEVLKEEAGQLIARDLKRAAGYIHVALPVAGSDRGDYQVRMLLGMDPRQGWLAVGEAVEEGQSLMLVRRDPQSARLDMERMLADVNRRLAGRPVRAAFYHSCLGRGRHIFGGDQAELDMIGDALGEVPLVGFFGHGEFSGERLYAYTGVLTLLVGEAA
ncbi:MAG TPA: FIST C-terminal domain-containing protein [Magnetospirillum sp.]|jgi:small ligand-binding sensory domain FIST|nr:FIST C-terminal domain-containing protein [Magnetospirillum sp.]